MFQEIQFRDAHAGSPSDLLVHAEHQYPASAIGEGRDRILALLGDEH
jgi:hypothetical protein